MTPLKLELSGFSCFREPQNISFEDLGLFAIAGPTGAGKSTILDAMTYALYGQTARLGSRGLEALISPGSREMHVRLTFLSGEDTYRVTRYSERKAQGSLSNQTRIERLEADARWRQLPESERLREAKAKLEAIVGLDYEGFTRAVLLPQGMFDEFLSGDAVKRRKLLVSLLSLDRVEAMRREAGRRSREAETVMRSLEVRLGEDYQGVSPQALRRLEEEKEHLQERQAQYERRLVTMAADLKELEEIGRLTGEAAVLTTKLEELRAREAEMADRRERLERARRARLLLPQTARLEQLGIRREQAQQEWREASSERRRLEGVAAEVKEEWDRSAARSAEQLPELERRLGELAAMGPLMEQLRARGGEMAMAGRAQDELVYSEAAWSAWLVLASKGPEVRRLAQALREANERLERQHRELMSWREEQERLRKVLISLEAEGLRAKEAYRQAVEGYREAEREDHAAFLRQGLAPGDPCPVCGQPVGEVPTGELLELAPLEERRAATEEVLHRLRERYQQVRGESGALEGRLLDKQEELKREKASRAAARQAWQELSEEFRRQGVDDLDAFEKILEEQRNALLASLARRIAEVTGGELPEVVTAELVAERERLERSLREAERRWRGAERELEGRRAEEQMRGDQLAHVEEDIASLRADLQRGMTEAGFGDAEEVEAAALSPAEIETLAEGISAYASERAAGEQRLLVLREELAGRSFDEAALQALRDEQRELSSQNSQVQTELGRRQRELEQLGAMLERARALRKELAGAETRYATYHQLDRDLRGNAFQDYLMGRLQDRLASRASRIMRDVSEGRFDLHLIEGEYHVRDTWNTGALRNVRTLSGGESFIASLSLALALSDTLAGNRVLGALFLDEGFGSLDAATLEAVADVLEALTREGRMVGIITHVTDLTERLPARLLVSKGPNGSTVSWDG